MKYRRPNTYWKRSLWKSLHLTALSVLFNSVLDFYSSWRCSFVYESLVYRQNNFIHLCPFIVTALYLFSPHKACSIDVNVHFPTIWNDLRSYTKYFVIYDVPFSSQITHRKEQNTSEDSDLIRWGFRILKYSFPFIQFPIPEIALSLVICLCVSYRTAQNLQKVKYHKLTVSAYIMDVESLVCTRCINLCVFVNNSPRDKSNSFPLLHFKHLIAFNVLYILTNVNMSFSVILHFFAYFMLHRSQRVEKLFLEHKTR